MIQYGFFKILVLTLLFALAGFIDSIAGGGGLVSLTSLYAAGLPAVNAVSTNKFSMTFGTLFATFNYAKERGENLICKRETHDKICKVYEYVMKFISIFTGKKILKYDFEKTNFEDVLSFIK